MTWYKITRLEDDGSLSWMGHQWGAKIRGWEPNAIYTQDEEVWKRAVAHQKGYQRIEVAQPPDPALDGMPKVVLSTVKRKKWKVVPFVPAGRERTLSILVKYFLKHKAEIDHVQLWVNTQDKYDLAYLKSLESDFFRLMPLPKQYKWVDPMQLNTSRFYEYCQDDDTIYIRFDDDIVYIDDDFFKNIVKFRVKHQDYFVVYANIWNNAIISHLQQKAGNISTAHGKVTEFCMDEVGWANPNFAEYIHYLLMDKIADNVTSELFIPDYELKSKKFSVSCFAVFGKDIKQFGGVLPIMDEEQFYAVEMPKANKLTNCICGSALVSHFSFFRQRKHLLENTNLLQAYAELAENKLAADYYKLLGEDK